MAKIKSSERVLEYTKEFKVSVVKLPAEKQQQKFLESSICRILNELIAWIKPERMTSKKTLVSDSQRCVASSLYIGYCNFLCHRRYREHWRN